MIYCVYKHTLNLDGRVYIGITSKKPKNRWCNGKGYSSCTHFNNAIKKYGWDNFLHEIIEENLTEEEAKNREIFYISKYNSTDPNFGFNIRQGGDLPSELQFKSVNIYGLDGKYIKTFTSLKDASEELSVNVNSIVLCCKEKDYKHSLNKKYLARYNTEEFPPNTNLPDTYICYEKESRKICVYTYTGKFLEVLDNAYECSIKYKVDIASIYHSCNEDGKCKVAGSDNNVFRWYSDNTNDITIDYTPKRRKINSYSLDGKYIATYKTQSEASKVTGVNKKSIGLCCKFVVGRAGNFMFRFSDDFEEGIDIEPYIDLRRYNGK